MCNNLDYPKEQIDYFIAIDLFADLLLLNILAFKV